MLNENFVEEAFCLHKYIQQIEDKLPWGVSKNWTNQDYQKLSERIYAACHIVISVLTLWQVA